MISREEFKKEVMTWADKIRVTARAIHIRPMSRKWASCSSKGRLSFNDDLLQEPESRRKEVIVHELLHLRYPNHGKMFRVMEKKLLG